MKFKLLALLFLFIGCSSNNTKELVKADVTVFTIKGNGEKLKLPVYRSNVRVDEIEREIIQGEKVYEQLSGLYAFKEYTLVSQGLLSVDVTNKQNDRNDIEGLLGFYLDEVNVEIKYSDIAENVATLQIRFEKNGSNTGYYQTVSVENGKTVSVGTVIDESENTGILIAIACNMMTIDDGTTGENILQFYKDGNFDTADISRTDIHRLEAINQDAVFKKLTQDIEKYKKATSKYDVISQIVLPPITPESEYYPETAIQDKVGGEVKIAFNYNRVEQDISTRVLEGVRADLDEAALRYFLTIDPDDLVDNPGLAMFDFEIVVPFELEEPNSHEVQFVPYDTPPQPLTSIQPEYPVQAKEAGIEGMVIVQCFINKMGEVREAKVLKGIPNTGFDASAIESITNTKFNPATRDNEPVGAWISVPITYKLKNN